MVLSLIDHAVYKIDAARILCSPGPFLYRSMVVQERDML
jgi:hypothetical protein